MVKKAPQSLIDAINENPERFLSYLNLDEIKKSKNPYKEFLLQFYQEFNSTNGLNLWQYLKDNYKQLNNLYNEEGFQKKLPEGFKKNIKKKDFKEFFEVDYPNFIKQQTLNQIKETKKEKKIRVDSYLRNGKKIPSYKKYNPLKYNDRQERFLKQRSNYNLNEITSQFNTAFSENRSIFAIRDKIARLEGRKT